VYDTVGNPFQLPASLWFAARHGVGLQRWDRVVGNYPLVPGVLGYEDGSYRRARATWNLAGPGGDPYLIDGYGPPQRAGALEFRWTTGARSEALLPILMLEVTVSCNGNEVARAPIGASWTTLAFDTDGAIGENRIVIEAAIAPYRIVPGAGAASAVPPPPAMPETPVGVALAPWRIALPP
jgi:hypothetical protein